MSDEIILEIINYAINNKFDKGRIFENSNSSLNRLSIELLKIQSGDIVFDLGSGLGSFLIDVMNYSFDKKIILKDLAGIDYNVDYVNIANMALKCLGNGEINPKIKYANALEQITCPYNKGFVYPPIGMKQNNIDKYIESELFDFKFTSRNSMEWIFIDRLLKYISGDTRAVALIPLKPLYNDADKQYRNILLNKGLIEGIIELPNGSLEYSGMKMCLVVFSRDNRKVKILDTTNSLTTSPTRFNKINLPYNEITKSYFSKDCETKTVEELIKLNNISPSNLSIKIQEIKNGIILSDVTIIFSSGSISTTTVLTFVDLLVIIMSFLFTAYLFIFLSLFANDCSLSHSTLPLLISLDVKILYPVFSFENLS